MFKIIQRKKIWFSLSGLLCLISILSLLFWGLKLSIDFTGGSLIELRFKEKIPTSQEINDALKELNLPYLNIQSTENRGVIIKTKTLTEQEHQEILKRLILFFNPDAKTSEMKLTPEQLGLEGVGLEDLDITATISDEQDSLPPAENYFEELRFDSIGPTIGKELQQKAVYSIILVNLAIIFYIAYAFRKVSLPVESWKYGVAAVIALIHDILIVTGVYSILSHFYNLQVDSLFVTAILTILGFSVHDTIVTFDRIRENLHHHQDKTFEEVVNISVNETMVRSLNTSATVFLTLMAVYLFGGQTISHFILTLIFGVIIGTYSSIFIASPLLLIWYRLKRF